MKCLINSRKVLNPTLKKKPSFLKLQARKLLKIENNCHFTKNNFINIQNKSVKSISSKIVSPNNINFKSKTYNLFGPKIQKNPSITYNLYPFSSDAYDPTRFTNRMNQKEMKDKKYPHALSSSEKALDMITKSHEVGVEGNEHKILITGYNSDAFQVNDSIIYPAPIVAFSKHIFFWKIPEFEKIDIQHFKILELILPEIDTVLIGTGKITRFLPKKIRNYYLSKDIAIEHMKTGSACNTFNTMNFEDRSVALFAIPPKMFNEDRTICSLKTNHNFEFFDQKRYRRWRRGFADTTKRARIARQKPIRRPSKFPSMVNYMFNQKIPKDVREIEEVAPIDTALNLDQYVFENVRDLAKYPFQKWSYFGRYQKYYLEEVLDERMEVQVLTASEPTIYKELPGLREAYYNDRERTLKNIFFPFFFPSSPGRSFFQLFRSLFALFCLLYLSNELYSEYQEKRNALSWKKWNSFVVDQWEHVGDGLRLRLQREDGNKNPLGISQAISAIIVRIPFKTENTLDLEPTSASGFSEKVFQQSFLPFIGYDGRASSETNEESLTQKLLFPSFPTTDEIDNQSLFINDDINGWNPAALPKKFQPFFDIFVFGSGKVSEYLKTLKKGDVIECKFSSPKLIEHPIDYVHVPNRYEHIGMIAEKESFLPFLQVLEHINLNPKDGTKVTLVYLGSRGDFPYLDKLGKQNPNIEVYYSTNAPILEDVFTTPPSLLLINTVSASSLKKISSNLDDLSLNENRIRFPESKQNPLIHFQNLQ